MWANLTTITPYGRRVPIPIVVNLDTAAYAMADTLSYRATHTGTEAATCDNPNPRAADCPSEITYCYGHDEQFHGTTIVWPSSANEAQCSTFVLEPLATIADLVGALTLHT